MELNYDIKIEIDTTPGATATFAELAAGWKNLAKSLNEVVYQASYLKDNGWGSSEVTGGQLTVVLTGDRIIGDAAQDYIFGDAVKFAFGSARKTNLKITQADATVITWPVTLANISDAGGDANQPNAVSVTIHSNGAPTIT